MGVLDLLEPYLPPWSGGSATGLSATGAWGKAAAGDRDQRTRSNWIPIAIYRLRAGKFETHPNRGHPRSRNVKAIW